MKDNQRGEPVWFKGALPESWVTRFTVGSDHVWDTMLLPHDLQATAAHVKGLVRAGVMTEEESSRIQHALDGILGDWKKGDVTVAREDEDCHTVIERLLTAELGETGKKVHTARSRNDQVLAALRLWIREQLQAISLGVVTLGSGLLAIAESEAETFLPGYTHMQRAMPSSVGLWAAGFAECLADDLDYLREARRHINVSPLGSGAGFGVPHVALDRAYVAELLEFEGVQQNVTTVQLSRGKLELGVVHALSQLAATINRLSADLVLYSSAEFGFLVFAGALTTGSSIMPQKRNPDVAELARAAMHRISAEAHTLLSIPANLPSGYHRDLQMTKEAVMRSMLSALELVEAMNHLIGGISFDRRRLEAARSPELFATAAAMIRVRAGTPFREAYREVADDPEAWSNASETPFKETYLYEGTPGRPVIQAIRERLSASGI